MEAAKIDQALANRETDSLFELREEEGKAVDA
jgi:hypothetical protein